MKIVIVGGHHVSALVLAKLLRDRGHEIFWFGTRFPRWPERTEGVEYKQVKASGFAFFDLKTGKFHRNFRAWWRIPLGFLQASWYLFGLKPDLTFSFGGYLAVPVVLASWCLRISVFTHEQTRTAGLANRFIKFFVRKIFLTWPCSAKFFPKKKTIFVGLPVRKEILFPKKGKIFQNDLPTILVVGGKQGSHVINCCLEAVLSKILLKFNLAHQCGDILAGKDFKRLVKKRESLPQRLKERYLLQDFFLDEQMGQNLEQADFVISRAGAHIVYELALVGKPAIFVPLPFAFAHEQEENAKLFTKADVGKIIPQEELNGEILLAKIEEISARLDFYKKNAVKLANFVKPDAGEKIVEYIEKYIYEKKET